MTSVKLCYDVISVMISIKLSYNVLSIMISITIPYNIISIRTSVMVCYNTICYDLLNYDGKRYLLIDLKTIISNIPSYSKHPLPPVMLSLAT